MPTLEPDGAGSVGSRSHGPPGSRAGMLTRRALWTVLGLLWLTAIVVGIRWLDTPSSPGTQASAPEVWPSGSTLALDAERPTVLMFIHPHCPCTRRSLTELADVVASHPRRASVVVVVYAAGGPAADWHRSERWSQAAGIPGAVVVADTGERERERFGVFTSGQVAVYDPSGRLRFRGGITPGSGHGGSNPGKAAVERLLSGSGDGVADSPVFGCSLVHDPTTEGR